MKFKTYWVLETEAETIQDAKDKVRDFFTITRGNFDIKLDPIKHKHAWLDESDLK